MIRKEDGDDGDGEEVVDHSKRQQKSAHRRRQVSGQHREHRKRERDVRGDRDRPSVEVFGAAGRQVDRDEDGGRDDHASDGRGDRQRRPGGVAQVARDELALELQADDEEEDRQQPIGSPRRDGQMQMQRLRTDREFRHRAIALRPRRIRPHQRRRGRGEQQHAADRFLAQDLGEPPRLRPRTAGQQTGRHWPKSSERA